MLGDLLEKLITGRGIQGAYGLVFGLLLLCGFGLPMPEDIILVMGGYAAWYFHQLDPMTFGRMIRDGHLLTMVAFGLGGILAGDSVIFFAGRKLGHRVAEFRLLRRIVTPQKLMDAEKLLRRRGNLVVVVARFLPGLRAPTYFTVGHSKLPYWEFVLFDGAAAMVSAPLWVCLGFYFGSNLEEGKKVAGHFSQWILGAALLVVAAVAARWWWRRRKGAAAPR
jgi:membrane protein DedA with SNARE-associated domain